MYIVHVFSTSLFDRTSARRRIDAARLCQRLISVHVGVSIK